MSSNFFKNKFSISNKLSEKVTAQTTDLSAQTIDYNSYRSIKFNRRSRFIVLHYTVDDFAKSIEDLTKKSVSSHYLVPQPDDPSYKAAGFDKLRIFNLVDELERAWHAGVSSWLGRNNLNDSSIGIEIVNQPVSKGGKLIFPPYPPSQIKLLESLLVNLLQRYPDVEPTHVVGHSDIAFARKLDPGPKFPWEDLYNNGIGAWYDQDTKDSYVKKYTKEGLPDHKTILQMFFKYGYDISAITSNEDFKNLVSAFQMHFRQENYDGKLDAVTAATLAALVQKYRSNDQ